MNVPAILHAGHDYLHALKDASDCGRQPRLSAAAPAPQAPAVPSGAVRALLNPDGEVKRRQVSFPCLTQDRGECGSGAGDVGSGAMKQQRSSGRVSGSSGELTHQSPGVLPT